MKTIYDEPLYNGQVGNKSLSIVEKSFPLSEVRSSLVPRPIPLQNNAWSPPRPGTDGIWAWLSLS